jgi:uncharacterized protein (TIGR02284 family)
MANNEQVGTLETLTTTLIDSVNGFEEAAKDTENPRFEQLFNQYAQERRQAVETLQSEIRRLGGDPPTDGSIMGKTHQTWLDLKAAVGARNDEQVIKSVENGEDYLKEKFETALNSGDLTGEARQAVERAYQSVRSGHDRMSALKHQVEAQS